MTASADHRIKRWITTIGGRGGRRFVRGGEFVCRSAATAVCERGGGGGGLVVGDELGFVYFLTLVMPGDAYSAMG